MFVGLAVIQVSVGLRPVAPSQMETLPDGHTLRLERVAYGTKLAFGSELKLFLATALPEWIRKKVGIIVPRKLHEGDPALAVWLIYDGSKRSLGHRLEYRIGDETGYFGDRNSGSQRREIGGTNQTLIGLVISTFPRRSREIRLGVFQPNKSWQRELVAEFVFDNPVYGTKFPIWPSEILPVARQTNGLEIALERLAFGADSSRRFRAGGGIDRQEALAAFVVRTNGQVTKEWKPDGVFMTDATGNERKQSSWGNTWAGITNLFHWSPTLWPDTGGMRFLFEFTRESTAGFATNELIELKGLAIPGVTNVTELDLVTNVFGHSVRIVGIAGKDGRFPDYQRMGGNEMTLQVEVKPPMLDKQIDILSAVDGQGRVVKCGSSTWSRDSGTYAFRIEPPNHARTVDIRLAVHESVYVNFVVNPELLVPDESAK